ncbi:hypothetical protein K9N50_08615 [bacterium]|nr:hypothetical protein [bacterium]
MNSRKYYKIKDKWQILSVSICLLFVFNIEASAIGDATAIFLEIEPGARSTGMGHTGVALVDQMSAFFNPGSMGIFAFENVVSYSKSESDWLPAFNIPDLWIEHEHIFLGVNIKKFKPEYPFDLSIGLEHHEKLINLGESPITDDLGNTLGYFETWEKSEVNVISLGFEYGIEVGLGLGFNHVTSHLGSWGMGQSRYVNEAEVDANDWGFIVRMPLRKTIEKLYGINTLQYYLPDEINLIPSFGYSRSNMSDKLMKYPSSSDGDPIPELSRTGFALEGRVEIPNLPLLSVTYSRDFIRHYVEKNTDKTGQLKESGYGFEANLFNTVQVRFGHYDAPDGDISHKTEGLTIMSKGLSQVLLYNAYRDKWTINSVPYYLLSNFNIKYSTSKWDASESSGTVDNTTWVEFGFSL